MYNDNDVKKVFCNSGYKFTTQRAQILKIIQENSTKHLSAEEIYQLSKKNNLDIGLATIYRTLAVFEKMKLVISIKLDDGFTRYQFANQDEEHEHHHLICESCGRVEDIQEDFLESLEKQVMKKNGFKVTNHQLKLFGLCSECLKLDKE